MSVLHPAGSMKRSIFGVARRGCGVMAAVSPSGRENVAAAQESSHPSEKRRRQKRRNRCTRAMVWQWRRSGVRGEERIAWRSWRESWRKRQRWRRRGGFSSNLANHVESINMAVPKKPVAAKMAAYNGAAAAHMA